MAEDDKVTERQVVEKMKTLGVVGWSSMQRLTPEEVMRGLNEIEKMTKDRRDRANEDK